MAFTEDITEFFQTFDHAVEATYSGNTIKGILNNEYFEIDQDHGSVESQAPVFHCRSADVSGVAIGSSIIISSITYTIRSVQPDGTGVTVLILESQAT